MINMLLASFDNLSPMNTEVLKTSLNILWQGLLAIFVVIGLIIIAVSVVTDLITKSNAYKEKHGKSWYSAILPKKK